MIRVRCAGSAMPVGPTSVNTSRGPVIDEVALTKALTDESSVVRIEAASALVKLGDSTAALPAQATLERENARRLFVGSGLRCLAATRRPRGRSNLPMR